MRNPSVTGRRALPRVRLAASAAFILLLSACNASSVMEPTPRVDVAMATSALPPMREPAPVIEQPQPVYVEQPQPIQPEQPMTEPFMAQVAPPSLADVPAVAVDEVEEYPEGANPTFAEAQVPMQSQPAGRYQSQPDAGFQPPPVVAGPQVTEAPVRQPVQIASAAGMVSPAIVTGYPRVDAPMTPAPGLPDIEVRCRQELRKLGVEFRDLPPINDGGACRIDHPVKVSLLPQGVNLRPAATLTCRMALTFARWTRNELTPAARTRYLSGVKTIHQGSSYSCRNIRTSRNRTPSEHSRGNAIDIMRIELKSGRDIDVRKPGFFAFREKGLLNNVRSDACRYFSTVLGPGYDRDHKDHFHFDIMARRNGYVACR